MKQKLYRSIVPPIGMAPDEAASLQSSFESQPLNPFWDMETKMRPRAHEIKKGVWRKR